MLRPFKPARRHWSPRSIAIVVTIACLALAGVALAAKTFTLNVAKNGKVTNQHMVTKHEAIVVNSKGFAVYWLTNDTKKHTGCASACWPNWPPVTVASLKKLSKDKRIKGKLGTWKRAGLKGLQATLNGHPLYVFAFDPGKRDAVGEGIMFPASGNFPGGTWHVVLPKSFKKHSTNSGGGNPLGW